MKLKFLSWLFLLFVSHSYVSQNTWCASPRNKVTIANGESVSINKVMARYFRFLLYQDGVYNYGSICFQDYDPGKSDNNRGSTALYEVYRIFKIVPNNNGTTYYWTLDSDTNGNTVLFEVDKNAAIPKITVSRYAPGEGSSVLKRTEYYLE